MFRVTFALQAARQALLVSQRCSRASGVWNAPSACAAQPSVSALVQGALRTSSSSARADTPGAPGVGRLNHVAIAVPDVQQSAERWRSVLGAKVVGPQDLPEHGVRVMFVELPNAKLELLEPLGPASPIAKFLQRNPAGGLHHICLEVDDIQASLRHVKGTGRMRLLDERPKIGAHGVPVVFAHPKDNDGVLTELEQAVPVRLHDATGKVA